MFITIKVLYICNVKQKQKLNIMTTLENIKSNKNLTWLLNNSEITFEDMECKMTHFKGRVPSKMLNELRNWFDNNGGNRCGGTIKVGLGSANLYTSKFKGDNTITFTTALAK